MERQRRGIRHDVVFGSRFERDCTRPLRHRHAPVYFVDRMLERNPFRYRLILPGVARLQDKQSASAPPTRARPRGKPIRAKGRVGIAATGSQRDNQFVALAWLGNGLCLCKGIARNLRRPRWDFAAGGLAGHEPLSASTRTRYTTSRDYCRFAGRHQ